MSKLIIEAKSEDDLSGKTVLVDFYANWCGPCRMLAPVLESIAEELTEVKIVKVNTEELGALAQKHNVSALPTLMLFKDGKVADIRVGLQNKENILELIKKHE